MLLIHIRCCLVGDLVSGLAVKISFVSFLREIYLKFVSGHRGGQSKLLQSTFFRLEMEFLHELELESTQQ